MLPEVAAVVFIPLTSGKVAVIDFDDFEKIRPHKWFALKKGNRWYAARWTGIPGKINEPMHRFLTDAPLGTEVDHYDGDSLNNQRRNLRVCSRVQNARAFRVKAADTTSKFRGVSWDNTRAKWFSKIESEGKQFPLGRFDNEEDAARAYDKKARELFGEWASPNFPA